MLFLKTVLLPGTFAFALLVGVVAALLMCRSGLSRRVGAALAALVAAGYLVLALPYTAGRLSAPLRQFGRLPETSQAGDVSAILLLTGDSTHARFSEALRLSRILQDAPVIVSGSISGTTTLRDDLVAEGLSPARIIVESASDTTRQQAVNVAALVQSRRLGRVVLVASAIHMPRALAVFRANGVDAVPSASPTRSITGLPRFRPAREALRLSRESAYEHVALAYYRWRGWIP
jgi:uncharacterized SAM-binding protein YcdF (DUF218 family)